MNLELVDKTALISGSTKGIGFAVSRQLATEGARVIVNGRSDNAVNSALKQIRKTVPEAPNRIAEPAVHFPLLIRSTRIYPFRSGTSMALRKAFLAYSIFGIASASR
jgi:NAD(P)-dependent dehydrogenase (short-subunit alcohol dehydrogenase family)